MIMIVKNSMSFTQTFASTEKTPRSRIEEQPPSHC